MMRKTEMNGKWIPGVSRQDLKKIKELPVPLFREWLINYSNEIQFQGAVAEKALILEALHREFGFGKVRLERVLDRAMKIKKELDEMDWFREENGKNEIQEIVSAHHLHEHRGLFQERGTSRRWKDRRSLLE